jgi:hypothetical protein
LNKYQYSNDTNTFSGSLTAASIAGSAAGNACVGIFALGCISGVGPSTTRNKYTYASNVVTTAGSASALSAFGAAASNGTTGVNV